MRQNKKDMAGGVTRRALLVSSSSVNVVCVCVCVCACMCEKRGKVDRPMMSLGDI